MSRNRLLLSFALIVALAGAWLVVDARNPCRVERPLLPESWFAAPSAPAPICGYRVVASYPHDPGAFIQGLQWVDGAFIEGTGLVGRSSLRRVDPVTGTITQQIDLDPRVFGEGIVVVGERIYQLTWQDHVGYVYDRATFRLLQTWQYPTEGWGLTYDGENLVMSDGSANLYFVDPVSLATVGQVAVTDGGAPVVRLNELEYIDGAVFANIWQTQHIVRIDPATGRVLARIDFTGVLPESQRAGADVLNGIAYAPNERRLFVTGKLWPSLFEVEVTDPTR
ncbi:MAG: glutaminyl-peptide cyclotransferase [Anaerolineales bacterium]|nr:glutaminyl-peptide cyclotransferase [Anaerolineales bacterium]